jgi:type II secretory pathway component GspD/PulD (secretin)
MMSISIPRHRMPRSRRPRARFGGLWLCALLLGAPAAWAQSPAAQAQATQAAALPANLARASKDARTGLVTLRFHDVALREVFDLLSRQEKTNILLGKGVDGQVSVSLYDVTVDQAVRSVAEAAGFAVEQHHGSYLIVDRKEVGQDSAYGATVVRSYKVQYSSPKQVADILAKHVSRHGKITPLAERSLLLVEDTPEFQTRIAQLLDEIDQEPRQILIEARILEITLDQSETFGVDWSQVFGAGNKSSGGTKGLSSPSSAGLFFNIVNRNLDLYLSALSSKGRVQTLSTPRLLALENQQASAVIGDRVGYKVTTTINQVTSETIQFLDTGVILQVTPSVDQRGRIMMQIHPEVSSATMNAGIPSKKSTEVTTRLLCEDGQSIFIGGLIKRSSGVRRTGVPGLGEVPMLGRLFSSQEDSVATTETVVVITPRIVGGAAQTQVAVPAEALQPVASPLGQGRLRLDLAEPAF